MSLHSYPIRDRPRVLFYVQHLLGTGHIKRCLILTDAMREAGHDVYLVSGGPGIPDMPADDHVLQLPPVRTRDQSFRELIDEHGNRIDPSWKSNRCQLLLDHYQRLRPDVVIIESYPFGRRQFRFELIPLLNAIQAGAPRPSVICSIRDVVQARPPGRVSETVEMLQRYFDMVMIHGDPRFIRFEESFPAMQDIMHLARYTGYVAAPTDPSDSEVGTNEVIVSGGGGAVSTTLLKTALKARELCQSRHLKWRILVGQSVSTGDFDWLRAHAGNGLVVEQNRNDFRVLLSNCALSISQAGYNTVMDLMTTGARSVVVPFEGNGETEQICRARKLQHLGMAEVVTESELSAATLALAIDRCEISPKPGHCPLNLEGAVGASRLVSNLWKQLKARK